MFHFLHKKNNFLKISPKEYHIFRGNYAYQPDWKEKNALPSSYKKFYIAVHIGFSQNILSASQKACDLSINFKVSVPYKLRFTCLNYTTMILL